MTLETAQQPAIRSNNAALPAQRSAIVTGGASRRGIGRAVAERLAQCGWSVAILDLDGRAAEQVASRLADRYGSPCLGLETDITDPTAVHLAVSRVVDRLPPLCGLVNVAGVSSPVPFLDVTVQEWDRVFEVNSRAVFLITQAAARIMVAQRCGRIVSIASASAQRGGGTYSKVPYSASKAAVLGLTRAVARELGEFGITVNAVSPGPIDTDIMGGELTAARRQVLIRDLPIGRIGTVEDVAAVTAFLMSADAGYITGATYNVNGGLIID
ncbi:MAG: SDR family oxidoreductase [Actinomycetota bacterium]|nr:SDR family oxidoreductase [Actinomycetota bacterium]